MANKKGFLDITGKGGLIDNLTLPLAGVGIGVVAIGLLPNVIAIGPSSIVTSQGPSTPNGNVVLYVDEYDFLGNYLVRESGTVVTLYQNNVAIQQQRTRNGRATFIDGPVPAPDYTIHYVATMALSATNVLRSNTRDVTTNSAPTTPLPPTTTPGITTTPRITTTPLITTTPTVTTTPFITTTPSPGGKIVPPPASLSADDATFAAAYNASNRLPVAYVSPTFTAAAYSSDSFYSVFALCLGAGPLTASSVIPAGTCRGYLSGNLAGQPAFRLLNKRIPDEINSTPLSDTFFSQFTAIPFTQISDPDVHNGALFNANGTNKYKVVITGHEEYLTQQMRDGFKRFVNSGGSLITLDGNSFWALVNYDNVTRMLQYAGGHAWSFNGVTAFQDGSWDYWRSDNVSFIGGSYRDHSPYGPFCTVLSVPQFGYWNHEDTPLENGNGKVILDYGIRSAYGPILAYELPYGSGRVLNTGIFGSDCLLPNSNSCHKVPNPNYINFRNFLNYLIWRGLYSP